MALIGGGGEGIRCAMQLQRHGSSNKKKTHSDHVQVAGRDTGEHDSHHRLYMTHLRLR